MKINRLFEIVYILLQKETITAAELAQHFEVSPRTIFRDIDVLSGAGIPIFCSKGKGGGISLLEGYSFNSSLLSQQEQEEVLIALQTLMAAEYPDINSVLQKMSRLFKRNLTSWLHIDFSPWGSEDAQRELFPLLRKSIIEHEEIHFIYYNSIGQSSQRVVEPVQLVFKGRAWYLAAYCKTSNSPRIFKLGRMRDVATMGVFFAPRDMQPIIDYTEENVVHNTTQVILTIATSGAYRVYDEFEDRMISVNKDGSFTITIDLPEGRWLINYLLSYGQLLEKVEPDQVRINLLNEIQTMTKKLKRS